ncbi:MAG: preprotein translocase subunit YajC [Clostridia bacterium]|nr:preprotein translocase subunit YajC [Clostridia bacterium]
MEMIAGLLPMILMIVVFYFILIRPQRKKDKETKQMLANLKVGDNITTIGGIVGTIIKIKDEKIVIETGTKTEKQPMTLERWAVRDVEKKVTAD